MGSRMGFHTSIFREFLINSTELVIAMEESRKSLRAFYFLSVFTVLVNSNLYDPHVYPRRGPFFEGWYIRITDEANSRSVAVLFGLVLPGSTSNGKPAMISFLKTEKDGFLQQYNAFPPADSIDVTVRNGQPVTEDPNIGSPDADFTWGSNEYGFIHVSNEKTVFNFTVGNVNFRATIGSPVPWAEKGYGPQSWLTYLPLPLNWYVYSLRSPVISYVMTESNGDEVREYRGKGVAHMEKNWGKSFPRAWFWIEGVREKDGVGFAGSGGPVDFGPIPVRGHLIGYRNPVKDIELDFRPDNSVMNLDRDGCAGNLNITVWSPLHKLQISIAGPLPTFSDCLYGPEANGFTRACVESFNSIATITAYSRRLLGYTKIDEQVIPQSALEFGGFYVCNSRCSVNDGTEVK
ncbi:uncharacterized protein LOC141899642 [Tubulanus polymorphus]|uniref:uncharacterized protein LOC141899642 n=1 Tax=Tubulanus polymorphus TaxID=672921 RepID=UPI003DA64BC5